MKIFISMEDILLLRDILTKQNNPEDEAQIALIIQRLKRAYIEGLEELEENGITDAGYEEF